MWLDINLWKKLSFGREPWSCGHRRRLSSKGREFDSFPAPYLANVSEVIAVKITVCLKRRKLTKKRLSI